MAKTRAERIGLMVLVYLLMMSKHGISQDKPSPVNMNKILFLGNSITLHGPAEAIGWTGNWGMAASSQEKDYVHLVLERVAKHTGKQPKAMVKNIADFERDYVRYDIKLGLKAELDFSPDLVIVAIGENVPGLKTKAEKRAYNEAFSRLLRELKSHGRPTIVVRSCFWADPAKDEAMKSASSARGASWVDIGALGKVEANIARSERPYKHAGVGGHPGDKGMQAIAEAIWGVIEAKLKRN